MKAIAMVIFRLITYATFVSYAMGFASNPVVPKPIDFHGYEIRMEIEGDISPDSATVVKKNQKARLNVKGMTCSGCARTITKGVKKLPGIEQLTVRLEEKLVEVEFDSSKVSLQKIEDEIRKMGYKSTLLKQDEKTKESKKKE
jgi:copper chaperone CopZ